MLEFHLQQLWNDRRLPFHQFTLANAQSIEVIDVGTWNTAGSGPDFEFAQVRMDNLTWFGSVEFHLKASDWYKHQHHKDGSYNNVILHVVYDNDQPVFLNDFLLPTLELKTYLTGEFKFPQIYPWRRKGQIPCKSHLKSAQKEFRTMQLRSIKARLKRKYELDVRTDERSLDYYLLISKAFGTKSNSLSFELLTQQIPLRDHQIFTPEEILLTALKNEQGWKGKNSILTGYLRRRVLSWTKFLRWMMENQTQIYSEIQWEKGFSYAGITSKLVQNNLLINAKTYFILENGRINNRFNQALMEAMDFLSTLPKEKNAISDLWKTYGVIAKNALETQANLEIYQQFCTKNKCLHCCVGQQVLKS